MTDGWLLAAAVAHSDLLSRCQLRAREPGWLCTRRRYPERPDRPAGSGGWPTKCPRLSRGRSTQQDRDRAQSLIMDTMAVGTTVAVVAAAVQNLNDVS
jgi:hypothetical protein